MTATTAEDVCTWLDALLTKDPTAGMAPDVLDRLAAVYTGDRRTYMRVKAVLKSHGCQRDVDAAVRLRAREAATNVINLTPDDDPDTRVYSVLLDAPVSPEAVVPYGWILRAPTDNGMPALLRVEQRKVEGGVQRSERKVAADPIVITGWLSNLSVDRKMLEVSWLGGGKWRSRVIEREAARDSNKIVGALAPHGFDVTSSNRRDIVDYLAAYESRNKPVIPVRDVSEQMGWQPDGGFLLGEEAIGTATSFHGADAGDVTIARSIHSHGTLGGWRKAVALASEFPKVELAIYASLATPLLDLVHAPSFAIDWSGCSSQGKTTVLCIAASVWALPDERGRGLITSWDGTDVGVERRAATTNGLPLLIDETKRAKIIAGQSVVPQAVYAITNGQGRVRGSKTGLQEVRFWRTILLTTGEASIVDMSNDGGLAARMLTLWGSPFGGSDPRVPSIGIELSQHYGHAGPAFVRWLVAKRKASLEAWRKRYDELCRIYTVRLTNAGGEATTRIAAYLAVLELCAELAHPVLQLPWEYRSPVSLLADGIAAGSRSVDRAREALERIVSWAAANRECFWSLTNSREQRQPQQGWLGRWDDDDLGARWDTLYIFPNVLDDELRRSRYDAKAIVKTWSDRGWIRAQKGHRVRARFAPAGGPQWFVGIARERLEAAAGNASDDHVPPEGRTP